MVHENLGALHVVGLDMYIETGILFYFGRRLVQGKSSA
jgi:hypothetical protein